MSAGYAGRSLIEKLEYSHGQKVMVEGAPMSFMAELIYGNIATTSRLPADWLHIFVAKQNALHELLAYTDLHKIKNGLWVSWPKKGGPVETDITEQVLRDSLLPLGLVDVKVCSIDDIWSGLKFVRRKH